MDAEAPQAVPPPRPPPLLELTHAFGSAFGSRCGCALRGAALFADDRGQQLVRPVGRHVVVCPADPERGGGAEQTFPGAEAERSCQDITACALARGQQLFAACGLGDGGVPEARLYELEVGPRLVRSLRRPGGASERIACAAFSHDAEARHLCLVTRAPELLLVVLDWKMGDVVGRYTLRQPMDQIACNPLDSSASGGTVVSASGPLALGLWRVVASPLGDGGELVATGSVTGLPAEETAYADHQWLVPADGSLVACTVEGPAYVIEAGQRRVLQKITLPLLPRGQMGAAAHCVRCFPGGFVVGGAQGMLAIWERPAASEGSAEADGGGREALPEFRHLCTAGVRAEGGGVRCVDVGGGLPDGETKVLAGFADGGLGVLSLASLRATQQAGIEAPCALVASGGHAAPVTAMDTAAQRPLVVTACRAEASVRIWDYAARRCELLWEFPGEELTGVAVHPLGYFLAVSCSDRLRFMQILAGELKTHREVAVRGVRLVRFAHGGHLLAAAQGKLILVFSARTLSKVATLRGHASQVVSLGFEPDDRHLVAGTDDGGLCWWSTQSWTRPCEHAPPARAAESPAAGAVAVAVGAGGLAWAGASEAGPGRWLLRALRSGVAVEEEDVELLSRLLALWHHQGPRGAAVLAGSAAGSLMAWHTPVSAQGGVELALHVGGCGCVCVSEDARTVITAGDDGAVFIVTASGLEGGDRSAPNEQSRAPAAAGADDGELVMVNRGEIQKRQEERLQLAAESSSLKAQLQEDKERLRNDYQEWVALARQQDQATIQDLKLRYESLQQAATSQEREAMRQMRAAEGAHVARADALEASYGEKIRQEADSYLDLNEELAQLESQLEDVREEADRELEGRRAQREQRSRRLLEERDAELEKLRQRISFTQERFDAMLEQDGAENEQELRDLDAQHRQEMEDRRADEYRLKKEQDMLLRGLDIKEKERERFLREQAESTDMHAQLRSEAESLQRDVGRLKVEQREREMSLKEKELDIGHYKSKVNTLNKFKMVLASKLREVELSLQPKDDKIEELTAQLRELEAEFENQLNSQKEMEASLKGRKDECDRLRAEGVRLREEAQRKNRAIDRFHDALEKLVCGEQDVRRWPAGIKAIYAEHVDRRHLPPTGGGGTLPTQELRRQIDLLERKASTLKRTCDQQEASSKADKAQKTEENQALILELDALRRDRDALRFQAKGLEERLAVAEHRALQGPRQAMIADGEPRPTASGEGRAISAGEPRAGPRPAASPGAAAPPARRAATLPAGKIWKTAGRATKSEQDRKQMQKLLAAADLNQQQLKMQKLEHKLLEDQLRRLESEVQLHRRAAAERAAAAEGGAAATASPPAGAALAAARGAARGGGAAQAAAPAPRALTIMPIVGRPR